MTYSKADQTKKNKQPNLKKLSQTENKLFHDDIVNITFGICQLCSECLGDDFHHPKYGRYGADKDDTCQVLSCRNCHNECHANKHGEKNNLAIKIGNLNWTEYNG